MATANPPPDQPHYMAAQVKQALANNYAEICDVLQADGLSDRLFAAEVISQEDIQNLVRVKDQEGSMNQAIMLIDLMLTKSDRDVEKFAAILLEYQPGIKQYLEEKRPVEKPRIEENLIRPCTERKMTVPDPVYINNLQPQVSSDEALARKLQSEEDKALAFKMSKLPDKTETSRKGTPPLSKATSSPERHPKRPPTKRSPPVVGLGGVPDNIIYQTGHTGQVQVSRFIVQPQPTHRKRNMGSALSVAAGACAVALILWWLLGL